MLFTKQIHPRTLCCKVVALFAVFLSAFAPSSALAVVVPNTATGTIAGVDADLTDSNTFNINSTTLGLVKTAFLSDGTPIADGADVPKGTTVKFMIYVDNTTGIAVNDVSISDVLNAAFAYQAGTIKVDASEATGATEADIYAAVNAAAALTDAVSGADAAGITVATISAGSDASNAVVNVAANTVWALLYTVKVQ
ncbi:MAG: hypothetical protein ACKVU1_13185 [bacterium]